MSVQAPTMGVQAEPAPNNRPRVPQAFVVYAALTALLAAASFAVVAYQLRWTIDEPALFWLLATFTLAGELLPIPVPRRNGLAKVTISTAFAFAILLRFGLGPATAVYVLSVVIADAVERVAPVKILFNAAQYALAMMAAGAMLTLTDASPPLIGITAEHVPGVLAAGATFFLVNHALACVGAALLADLPIRDYMRDDLTFQAWTAGCLLAFAPAVVASAHATIALVPVCFVPMLAVYFGGRQAVVNSHRAHHDALTELPNRVLLADNLSATLDTVEREHRSLAVLLLDVDDFKAINDTLGHEFGDRVLNEIAQRLRGAVGEHDMLARLGGDEFAVVLKGDLSDAETAAQRLLTALDLPMDIDTLSVRVAASIGIACFPQHGRTSRELMRHADVALYCAKASDVSFQAYAEESDEYSIDRLALAAQLRRGIERGELTVHYQPKAPLAGGAISAVEALVRWNHPQLGRIGPDGFIPLAEQTGVIKPLTDRVLECSLHQCELWRREGLDITVSVNVSARSLLDHELPSIIHELLTRFDLPASVLQLEITESRIVADLRRARSSLEELRSMGVKIAIDDFGTGFSSLSQLQQLPIDEIKIDRSFVAGMERDRSDAVLVRSIIDLGRNLGLRVTAEGVESESVRASLSELGCDFVQGFHIGRPAAAEECRRYLDPPQEPPAPIRLAAVGLPQ
jgi:diguanylate cyclase (GGDEF)-like protein